MVENLFRRIYRRLFKPGPWRKWTADARVLPDFLVIGAMRSGTTSLYDLICRHPQVERAIKKEIHFFDLHYNLGRRWYRAHFPRKDALRRRRGITGEASPYYIYHPLSPRRAADVAPDAKIIAILRHPVDRAYSHYWHSVRIRMEPLSFEEALWMEGKRLAGEEQRLVKEPHTVSSPHIRHSYTNRSIYVDQLERWLGSYPRPQLLVIEHMIFFRDLDVRSRRLFDFLELDPHPARLPVELNQSAYPTMASATRAGLLEFFAPHNTRLFDLLGESFDWQD